MNYVPFEDFGGSIVVDLEQKQTVREIFRDSKNEFELNKKTNYFNLIEGLELPNVVDHLCLSKNNEYLFLGGSDPPQFVGFELENMSEKMRQHTFFGIVKMISLPSDDPFKLVCLYENRFVEFFCKYGKHEKVRVPKYCHDMLYHERSCNLTIFGYSRKLWKFNLELGQFLSPSNLSLGKNDNRFSEIFCGHVNPIHYLFGFGCDSGMAEFVDPRNDRVVGVIDCCDLIRKVSKKFRNSNSVRKISFDGSGISFGVGTNSGQIGLFDLRKDGILGVKDHLNDTCVTSLSFVENTKKVVSSDKYCVKIWDFSNSEFKNIVNMEPRGEINDVLLYPSSGMLFCAQERKKVTPYFVPSLGALPKWCSFLNLYVNNFVSSEVSSTYEGKDFKFLSSDGVKKKGLEKLVGTTLVKPHLNGYLVSVSLLERSKSLCYDEIEKILKKEKIKKNEKLGSSLGKRKIERKNRPKKRQKTK